MNKLWTKTRTRLQEIGQRAKLAIHVIAVGLPGDGVDRPIHTSGTELDKPWGIFYQDQIDAIDLWEKNPLGRRMINIVTTYIIGTGLSAEADDEELQKFINDFWSHDENNLEIRLPEMSDELTRSGELFPVLWTNPVDKMTYIRIRPTCQIEEVHAKPEDYEAEMYYIETPEISGDEPKKWYSPRALMEMDPDKRPMQNGNPVMLHYAINKVVGRVRGESDLTVIADWLRIYDQWLEDRAEMNAAIRLFLWFVTAPKNRIGDIKNEYQKPPQSGTVVVEEDGVTWTPVTPSLNARDSSADGRNLKWMIVAGGPGTALTDMGEGEDANLATAKAMGEQKRRFMLRRQNYFAHIIQDILIQAYKRQKPEMGMEGMPKRSDIRIIRPDISTTDNELIAKATKDMIGAFKEFEALMGRTEQLRKVFLRMFIRFTEEPISPKEFDELMKGDPEADAMIEHERAKDIAMVGKDNNGSDGKGSDGKGSDSKKE